MTLAALAFAFAVGGNWLLTRPSLRELVPDHPNERSLHTTPTPRTGGVAVLAALALSATAYRAADHALGLPAMMVVGGVVLIAAVSGLDDIRGASIVARLGTHVLAAGLVVGAGLGLSALGFPGVSIKLAPAIGALMTVLLIVWTVNLFNFMDGMDGFAGLMSVSGFATIGYLAWRGGDVPLGQGAFCVVAACLGFLVFNRPPARIFLGDVGSASLGFLAAVAVLRGAASGAFPVWVGGLTFAPFLVDATLTLLRRVLRSEAFWRAHRSHYYQRLVQAGWTHGRTLALEGGLMLVCSAAAILVLDRQPVIQWVALGLVALMFATLFGWIEGKNLFPGTPGRR